MEINITSQLRHLSSNSDKICRLVPNHVPMTTVGPKSKLPVHCVSKKVTTVKLSVTLSNLNRFSKCLHYQKACEICYKNTHQYIPNSPYTCCYTNLVYQKLKFSANIQQIWKNPNKLHFQGTDFNFSMRVAVFAECIYVFFIKILSSSLNTMLTVDKHCSDVSAVTNFRCHKLIAKVNKLMNTVTQKILFAISMGKNSPF